MSSSFGTQSPNSPMQQNESRNNQVNLLWVSCFLILIWFLLYLAKDGNDSAWEQNRIRRGNKTITMPLEGVLKGNEISNIETIVQAGTKKAGIDMAAALKIQPPKDNPAPLAVTITHKDETVNKSTV